MQVDTQKLRTDALAMVVPATIRRRLLDALNELDALRREQRDAIVKINEAFAAVDFPGAETNHVQVMCAFFVHAVEHNKELLAELETAHVAIAGLQTTLQLFNAAQEGAKDDA